MWGHSHAVYIQSHLTYRVIVSHVSSRAFQQFRRFVGQVLGQKEAGQHLEMGFLLQPAVIEQHLDQCKLALLVAELAMQRGQVDHHGFRQARHSVAGANSARSAGRGAPHEP